MTKHPKTERAERTETTAATKLKEPDSKKPVPTTPTKHGDGNCSGVDDDDYTSATESSWKTPSKEDNEANSEHNDGDDEVVVAAKPKEEKTRPKKNSRNVQAYPQRKKTYNNNWTGRL